MTRKEAFNTLFDSGFSYDHYLGRSDRHEERMKQSYTATERYLVTVDDERLQHANQPLKILCIAENWCGDCGNGVPVIAKLAEVMTNWQFQIAARDDHEELVENYYTTAGRKKIPVIIFADEDGDEINRWIERPARSYLLLQELKDKKLPKEEYIEEYKKNPELRPPVVSQNIVEELLDAGIKAATMNAILPKKR